MHKYVKLNTLNTKKNEKVEMSLRWKEKTEAYKAGKEVKFYA